VSKQDGQGKPVKIAHLLGKDPYAVLCNTAQPILNKGFNFLQDSTLLVILTNVKNGKDSQQQGLLVPRKAFIDSFAQPFQKFFMTKPKD
jgi:hypothetical protein